MAESLTGRVALVTGVSRRAGIGFADARRCLPKALPFSPTAGGRTTQHSHGPEVDAIADGESDAHRHAQLPILAELLQIETPVQIIGGLWDRAVPPSNHRYLHERLPKSKLDLVDAGHFTWEDAAEEYAEIVTSWWAGGFAKTGSGE